MELLLAWDEDKPYRYYSTTVLIYLNLHRKLDDFFLGVLEGASKHFQSEVKILGRKERGKLVVTIHVKEPEMAAV